MINAIVLGFMSLTVEPLGRFVGGAKRLWGVVNIILSIALAMTVLITKASEHERHISNVVGKPSHGVKAAAFSFFGILGIPLAV
jgi:solute carrier family 45 protein 1/2/4